jgi:hypothetical protein
MWFVRGIQGFGQRRWLLIVATAVSATIASASLASTAHAGQWVQISCENPNGSSAPSEGWTSSQSGSLIYPAVADTTCSAGAAMFAGIPTSTTAPAGSGETLTYTPPTGSTLAGGTMDVQLSADGYGSQSSGAALVLSPADSTNDEVETCATWSAGCWAGSVGHGPGGASDFTGDITLPPNLGGTITITGACLTEPGGSACDQGGGNGVWAGAWVTSADALLSSDAIPTAANFTGTILQPDASGTAQLDFTAEESDGPGIYNVTVDVDGASVYSGTPNTNNGECVAQGTYPGTSALEFDYAQPCPTQASVAVPIDTTALKNGKHELTVTVTDAAGDPATVEDTYITVDNHVTTPLPKRTRGIARVRVRFYAVPDFLGTATRLLSISHSVLPAGARVSLTVSGPHHPRLRLATATGTRVKLLLADLARLRFVSGDELTFTVTAPHRRAERVRVTFHDHQDPTVKLL